MFSERIIFRYLITNLGVALLPVYRYYLFDLNYILVLMWRYYLEISIITVE